VDLATVVGIYIGRMAHHNPSNFIGGTYENRLRMR
jgi:hypothetical protein